MSNTSNIKKIIYAGLVIAGLAFFVYFMFFRETEKQREPAKPTTENRVKNEFEKDGNLYFLDANGSDTLDSIIIEVADSEYETTKGLMYRRYMPDNAGMLFIFPNESERNFWMKNTHISLDILFINAKGEIINIAKYAKPKSKKGIPSKGAVKYVLEVNAGYSDIHRIEKGYTVKFEMNGKEEAD